MRSSNNERFFNTASEAEAELARTACQIFAQYPNEKTATLRMIDANKDIAVPAKAIQMLVYILEQMALGSAISIIPIHKELTTQEAAEMLNVSRPYLIKQILDRGIVPFHHAGNRRKIHLKDLIEYKKRRSEETTQLMGELASLSQRLDIMD